MSRSTLQSPRLVGPYIAHSMKLGVQVVNAGAAQYSIPADAAPVVVVDPGGGAIDVLLPPEEEGLFFWVRNAADAAEAIALKEDSDTTTILSLAQGESALVVCDGTTWYALQGTNT